MKDNNNINNMPKSLVWALIIYFFSASLANATLGGAVDGWFAQQDYSNVTPAGSFQTQSGRMFTGGGISTRSHVQSFSLNDIVTVQAPKISTGCGGIDMYTGGFTFIDKDQFVKSIRAIGQNAQSLAFMLAIKIVTPQLEDVMKTIKGYADEFNKFQTDSCAAASALLETGTTALGWTEQCIQLRMESHGEDRSTAKNECTTGGKGGEAPPAGKPVNTVAFIDGNIAWNALMQDAYFRNDLDVAEMMMNIMGTVVLDKGTGADPIPKVTARISNVVGDNLNSEAFKNIFNAMYLGNKTGEPLTMYQCDSSSRTVDLDSCKVLTAAHNVPVTFIGIKPRIDALLASITQKIVSGNGAFTTAEVGLIESTNLPLYRFIAAATASDTIQFSGTDNPAAQFSDIVAKDIVLRNIKSLVGKVRYRIDNDKNNLSAAPELKAYSKQLEDVMKGLTQLEITQKEQAQGLVEMQTKILAYEKQILPRISKSYIDAAKFGN